MDCKQLLPYAVIVIFLCGCTHAYYQPNQANVPVLKEQHEVHASASFSTNGATAAGDFQGAYAVTKNVGVLANANVNGYGRDSSNGGKGFLFELGAGYYRPINVHTKHANNLFVFETYGVLSLGRMRNFYYDSSGQLPYLIYPNHPREFTYPNNAVNMNYLKAYLQPSITFSHNIIDIILGMKVGFLHTFGINSSIPQNEMPPVNPNAAYGFGTLGNDWTVLNTARTPFLFEPVFALRLGYKYVKFEAQASFTPNYNPFLTNLTVAPWAVTVGVSVDIAHRFKEKKQPKHASGNEVDYN